MTRSSEKQHAEPKREAWFGGRTVLGAVYALAALALLVSLLGYVL